MAPKKENQKHNIDDKRFSVFLRYLDKHNATIELTTEAGYKWIYTSNQNDGNPSIRSMLMGEPLNFSEDTVNTFYLDWPMRDKHTYKDRVRRPLRIIDNISFYLDSDGRVDEYKNTLKEDFVFGVRNHLSGIMELKYGEEVFEEHSIDVFNDGNYEVLENYIEDCDPDWNQYFGVMFKNFPDYVIKEFQAFINYPLNFPYNFDSLSSSPIRKDHFPEWEFQFNHIIKKLSIIYKHDIPSMNINYEKDVFDETLEKAILVYEQFKNSDERDGYLMPNYRDFCIPKNITISDKYKSFISQNELSEMLSTNGDLNISWAIKHRYELIQASSEIFEQVDKWHPLIHSIVLLTSCEYFAFKEFLIDCIRFLIKDTRFIISGSKKIGDIDYQQDSITIDQLSNILTDFLFKKGLDKSFQINGFNLLTESVYKYAKPEVAKGKFQPDEINDHLELLLTNYYKNRILIDNFANDKDIKNMI